MHKHAMALGYFFLAVFCIFTSSQGSLQLFAVPLLLAAMVALLVGLVFLWSACAPQLAIAWKRLGEMVRLAQEPPLENSHRATDSPSAY